MIRLPDPGSPSAARLAGIAFLLLLGLVVVLQQLGSSALKSKPAPTPTTAPAAEPIVPPSPQNALIHSILLRINHASPSPIYAQTAQQSVADASAAGRFRLALVAAELRRGEADFKPTDPVDEFETQFTADALEPLRADIAIARDLYNQKAVDDEARAGFLRRHGYYGRLAAAYHGDDAARRAVLGNGTVLAVILAVAAFAGGAAVLLGVVLLIIAMVQYTGGRLRFRFTPPAPGGSIGIEIAAVFVAAFIALKGVGSLLLAASLPHETVMLVTLVLQWLLLLALLWPLARRIPLGATLHRLGLHRGRGVLTEAAWGVVGWIASLPIFIAGAMVSAGLMFAYNHFFPAPSGTSPVPENPVIQMVTGALGSAAIVLLALLASLWAPLAEELIFRGALYRHLRSRLAVIAAAVLTAGAFGLMHGYALLMLGPVIALGFAFSLLREWRDSLIAPIVAHCLHNSLVLGILIAVVTLAEI